MNIPGYEFLADVLERAYDQAAAGKGAERHACSRPFNEQPMQSISRLLGSHTGLLYQAMKKIQESERMDPPAAVRELLGAINYVAGAIIFMEAKEPSAGSIIAGLDKASSLKKDTWTCHCNGALAGISVPVGQACYHCHAIA